MDWTKPKARPAGMSPEEYAALPEKLRVREVRIMVEQKGFRSKTLDIVTTLFDAKIYTKAAIASLYRRRWSIERGFRFLKDPLFMASTLYLKSPKRIMALMMVMTL